MAVLTWLWADLGKAESTEAHTNAGIALQMTSSFYYWHSVEMKAACGLEERRANNRALWYLITKDSFALAPSAFHFCLFLLLFSHFTLQKWGPYQWSAARRLEEECTSGILWKEHLAHLCSVISMCHQMFMCVNKSFKVFLHFYNSAIYRQS